MRPLFACPNRCPVTNKELIDQMRGIENGIGSAHVLFVATGSTMDLASERIWGRGELTGGGVLTYNAPTGRGFYIYAPPFPKKGNGKGKYGAKIKGTYAASYKDAKDLIGRGDTPFDLTGALRKDWLGGVMPTPNEETPFRCTISVSQKSKDKIDGLAETKGVFVNFSESEIKAHHGFVLEAYRELVLNVQ